MLVEAAKIGGVRRIAIIDDAYDPPSGGEISEDAFNQFVQALDATPEIAAALTAQSALRERHLDDWETFTTDAALIQELWIFHIGGGASAEVDPRTQPALGSLFRDIHVDRISKLQQLKPLEDLLSQLNGTLWKLGADSEPRIVAKADVVFLDLYLSNEAPPIPDKGKSPRSVLDRARERAINYLRTVRSLTDNDLKVAAPAFVLISSQGTDLVGQAFRRKAQQTASRFRFVSKQAIAGGEPHGLLAIADIFRTREACAVIEPFQKLWPKVLREAQEWVAAKLLDLDISDFGRLYHESLRSEGQPVQDYVKELIAGALAERVSKAFSEHHPAPLGESPFAKTPSYFFEAPSNAFADLYGATRITQDPGFRGSDGMDPMSGDLYLEGAPPKGKRTSLNKRSIAAVMSPLCDLVGRNGKEPAAKSVLLLEGILRPATFKHEGEPQTVSVNGGFYEVEWAMKNPRAITMTAVKTHRRKNEWTWLGRLKAEHFLALQSSYLASIGRVGLLKSPGIFQPLAGQVWVRDAGTLTPIGPRFAARNQFAYLSPDQTKSPEKQPIFFSGEFIETFSKLITGIETDATRSLSLKTKAKGVLERMEAVFGLIEKRSATAHTINNYVRVDLLETKNAEPPQSQNGVFIIAVWKV